MKNYETVRRPSKKEQEVAMASYDALEEMLKKLDDEVTEIEIEETEERLKIPLSALHFLAEILRVTSEGMPVSIVPVATELTTQKAADILGCSRPHLVKLLEEGKIPYTKVGKHRRVQFSHVMEYKKKQKEEQMQLLIEIMQDDEELGLYDS